MGSSIGLFLIAESHRQGCIPHRAGPLCIWILVDLERDIRHPTAFLCGSQGIIQRDSERIPNRQPTPQGVVEKILVDRPLGLDGEAVEAVQFHRCSMLSDRDRGWQSLGTRQSSCIQGILCAGRN